MYISRTFYYVSCAYCVMRTSCENPFLRTCWKSISAMEKYMCDDKPEDGLFRGKAARRAFPLLIFVDKSSMTLFYYARPDVWGKLIVLCVEIK